MKRESKDKNDLEVKKISNIFIANQNGSSDNSQISQSSQSGQILGRFGKRALICGKAKKSNPPIP